MSTSERRRSAVEELARIVKPNGLILISVWALEQGIATEQKNDRKREKQNDPPMHDDTKIAIEETSGHGKEPRHLAGTEHGTSTSAANEGGINENGEHSSDTGSSSSSEARQSIAINETRNVFKQQDLLVPWHFRGSKGGSCKTQQPQIIQPERTDQKSSSKNEHIYHRFYHVFKEHELELLCQQVQGAHVVKSYHDRGNWCVILQKSADRV